MFGKKPRLKIVFQAKKNSDTKLIIEPWAEEFLAEAEKPIELEFLDPAKNYGMIIEISQDGEAIILWPNDPNSIHFYKDGRRIG